MKRNILTPFAMLVLVGLVVSTSAAYAAGFNSGSTGADGPFNPATNVTLTVPPDGRFNFTTINIPVGVTVTFTRNSNNTPVYFLASGDVVINGTIDVSGGDAGTPTDGTLQGLGGPGGYDGGRGGTTPSVAGGDGLGPGGGRGGADDGVKAIGGGGGGYLNAGANSANHTAGNVPGTGGPAYGSGWLQPLVGGSGGGGGSGSSSQAGLGGGGGGGGGGAILIASSGTISGTNGIITAAGGTARAGGSGQGSPRCDSSGGGGSAGAIHLIASAITLVTNRAQVFGGSPGGNLCGASGGGAGSVGFTKFEVLLGGTLDVSGPTLAITKVAGISAPATLTGYNDIIIPTSTPNPVTVEITATGIPTGGTVSVTVSPSTGNAVSVTSTPLSGTLASSTATAQIDVPNGLSSVQASTNYTVPLALVDTLTRFAGETVKNLKVTSVLNGKSKTLAITVSGREVEIPPSMLIHVALGPN